LKGGGKGVGWIKRGMKPLVKGKGRYGTKK